MNWFSRYLAILVLAWMAAVTAHAAEVLLRDASGVTVTTDDVLTEIQRAPQAQRETLLSQPDQIRRLVQGIYLRRALATQAEREGLTKEPEVDAILKRERERILADMALTRQIESRMPEEKTLEQYALSAYRASPERFKTNERVRVRHILISAKDPDARAKAQRVLALAKAPGADFEALAKEHSADPGSAPRGGDLGFFQRGRMVKSFEDAAFGMTQPGQVSDLVESQFGFHILKLEARQPAGTAPFEEVKGQLIGEVRARIAKETQADLTGPIEKAAQPDDEAIRAFSAGKR